MNTKEILTKLPNSWDEITLKDFQKLTKANVSENESGSDLFDGVENTIEIISKLTGVSVDDLEALPIQELGVLGTKLSFMMEPPKPSNKSILKWLRIDEIPYNSFVNYIQLQDTQLENLHIIIKNFSKTELTEEQILELPITEVVTGFFLFRKLLRKYLKNLVRLNKMEILKYQMKEKLQAFKQKMKM